MVDGFNGSSPAAPQASVAGRRRAQPGKISEAAERIRYLWIDTTVDRCGGLRGGQAQELHGSLIVSLECLASWILREEPSMHSRKTVTTMIFLWAFFVSALSSAAELPANFPGDVPVADYMEFVSVSQVGNDMMVDLHAQDQALADVVEWFQSELPAAGWQSDGETITERNAILAYSKSGRNCGVIVTNFVLNSSMQMDESTKGITLQLTVVDDPGDGASEDATEAADAAEN